MDDTRKAYKLVIHIKNEIIEEEDGLYSITTKPGFAIGQTAFVVKTESYRLLWDCITYLDETTITKNKKSLAD